MPKAAQYQQAQLIKSRSAGRKSTFDLPAGRSRWDGMIKDGLKKTDHDRCVYQAPLESKANLKEEPCYY